MHQRPALSMHGTEILPLCCSRARIASTLEGKPGNLFLWLVLAFGIGPQQCISKTLLSLEGSVVTTSRVARRIESILDPVPSLSNHLALLGQLSV